MFCKIPQNCAEPDQVVERLRTSGMVMVTVGVATSVIDCDQPGYASVRKSSSVAHSRPGLGLAPRAMAAATLNDVLCPVRVLGRRLNVRAENQTQRRILGPLGDGYHDFAL